MKKPTLSVIIPTAGRGDLPMTIHSINTQGLIEGDQILVIGDGPQHEAQDQIEALGEPYRFLSCDQIGDWGHTPCNFAIPFCTADYVLIQGDDDVFLPRAFDMIRAAIAESPEPRPLMFRFYTNDRWLVWAEEDTYELGPALVGDHNIVAPNRPDRLGRWETHYRGDLAYVRGTAGFYGGSAGMLWRKEIISRQRPQTVLFDWPGVDGSRFESFIASARPILHGLAAEPSHRFRYLFSSRESSDPLAAAEYAFIDGKFWASLWLSPDQFGKGYGRELVQHAIDAAQGDCFTSASGDVLHLLNELGFTKFSCEGGRVQLIKKFPV